MKRVRDRWILALFLVTLATLVSHNSVNAVKATSLIFRTTTTTTTTTEAPLEEDESGEEDKPVSSTPASNLTGIPQIDYRFDPNLPRELNGYNLSSYPFYETVPPPDQMDFKCDGLHDGFYASIPHKCQVYHHCLYGTRYDFLCANYTAFDQKTFICQFVSEVDCVNSAKYFNRNKNLYWEDWQNHSRTEPSYDNEINKTVTERKNKNQFKATTAPTTQKTTVVPTTESVSKNRRRNRNHSTTATTTQATTKKPLNSKINNSRKDPAISDSNLSKVKATPPPDFANRNTSTIKQVHETTTKPTTTTKKPLNSKRNRPRKDPTISDFNKSTIKTTLPPTFANKARRRRPTTTAATTTILYEPIEETTTLKTTTENIETTTIVTTTETVTQNIHTFDNFSKYSDYLPKGKKEHAKPIKLKEDDVKIMNKDKVDNDQVTKESVKDVVKDENIADEEKAPITKGKKHRGKSNSRNEALYKATTTSTVAPPTTTTTPTTTTSAPSRRPGSRRRPSRRRRPQYDYYDEDDEYYTPRETDEYDDEPRSGARPYGEGRRRRKRPRPSQRRPIYDDEYDDERYDRRQETRTRVEDDYDDRRGYDRPRNRRPYNDDDDSRTPPNERTRNKSKPAEEKRPATDYDRRPYDDDRRSNDRPRKPYRDEETVEEKRPSRERDERPSRPRDDYRPYRDERPRNEGRGNKEDQKDETRSFSDDQRSTNQQVEPTGAGLVNPKGASIYSKPRLPPRIARPVPSTEKDKYKYVTEASTTTLRPDDDYYEDYEDDPKTTSPSAKNTHYSRPREDDRYERPKEENRYERPKEEVRYERPKEDDRYERPKNNDRYEKPKEDDRYERPKEDDRYERPKEDDKYERPSIERTRLNFESDAPKKTVSSASNDRRRPDTTPTPEVKKNIDRESHVTVETTTSRRPNVYKSRYPPRTTTKKPQIPDEEYYYDAEEDDRVTEKPTSSQKSPFLSRNRDPHTSPTTTTSTTTTTTTTQAPSTSAKPSSYVKVVKRPFLPSRGGSPYLPRGLQPLGGKNFNKTSTTASTSTAATTTTTTTTENSPSFDYVYDADYDIKDYKDKEIEEVPVQTYEKPQPPVRYEPEIRDYNRRPPSPLPQPPPPPPRIEEPSKLKYHPDLKPPPMIPVHVSLTGNQKYEYERKPVIFNVNTNLRGEIVPKIPTKNLEQDYSKPNSKEVFRPSPQISEPYKPTNRPSLYNSKIPENISIKQNLADSIENDYDVTLNEALNPTLPNLTPIRNFPSPFVVPTDRDYTFARFRNPSYNNQQQQQQQPTQYNYQSRSSGKQDNQRFVGGFAKAPQGLDSSQSASESHGISIRTPQSFYIQHPRYSSSFSAAETNHGLRPGHILAYDYA